MALYGFKGRFVPAIERGDKRHTIRKPRTGKVSHAKPGGPITLKHGPRFKPVIIGRTTCDEVLSILLDFSGGHVATRALDASGEAIGPQQDIATARGLDRFAVSDGFTCWDDMREFWRETHDSEHFRGVLIQWRFPFDVR